MKNNYEVYGVNFIPHTENQNGTYVRETDGTGMSYAMAYVPKQRSIEPQYTPEDGFCEGTIFKDLNLPWEGVRYCE